MYIYYINYTSSKEYKNIEKELENPILIVSRHYILTDNYMINLRNGHSFKYTDIDTIYERVGFRIVIGNKIRLVKYLWIVTKDNKKDKFIIGYVSFIGTRFQDFSDIIIKKNMWVKYKQNEYS